MKLLRNVFVFFMVALLLPLGVAFGVEGPIRVAAEQSWTTVGFGTYSIRGTIRVPLCTFTIIRHGLLLTAKHCFEHMQRVGLSVTPMNLSIDFSAVKPDGKSLLISGSDIEEIFLDHVHN